MNDGVGVLRIPVPIWCSASRFAVEFEVRNVSIEQRLYGKLQIIY
jgi:hypothetical protein